MTPGLLLQRRGPVGWIVFDRAGAGNALDAAMMAGLPACWRELDDDSSVRAIVVTGRGPAFQTGVDVAQLSADPAALRASAQRTRAGNPGLTARHLGVTKPVVTAVNGTCAGGGLHFVVDSDLVIASSTATFLDPHVSLGQVSAFETIGLAHRTSLGNAARMGLLGSYEKISAQRAYEIGLVGEVVEPQLLEPRAQVLGEQLAEANPADSRWARELVWAAADELGRREPREVSWTSG